MALPIRRDDPKAVEKARDEVVIPAGAKAVADLYVAANRATIDVAQRVYEETSAVENPYVREMVAPHSEQIIEDAGNFYRHVANQGAALIQMEIENFERW